MNAEHTTAPAATDDHDVAHVRQHVRTYLLVFASLLVLTVVTVAVSRIELPTGAGIPVALAIASVKGALVAGVFMHLFSERVKAVLWLLVFAAVFFLVMVLLISFGFFDTFAMSRAGVG